MRHIVVFFLFFTLAAQAQFRIHGIVRDAKTNKPLPFATITSETCQSISDVDGKFSLESKEKIIRFKVSYIGYSQEEMLVDPNSGFYTVSLSENIRHLHETMVSNADSALDIIRTVIRNREANNPQKKLISFEFKAYNRLLVTANPDSVDTRIDTVRTLQFSPKKDVQLDSSRYKFKEMMMRRHLFETEKVSRYQFTEGHLKETILGTRMSGFRQPVYEVLGFNLQSFSIYDEKYELFETVYNSPIADDAPSDYLYRILDTVTVAGRTAYMIYFKNKKKRKAAGLEGVLYIDSENFAVAKAVMRIRGVLDISGTHEFQYFPAEKLWFPTSKNFKIVKGNNDQDVSILIGTIRFDAEDENPNLRKKEPSDYTYLLSETNYTAIQYNIPVKIHKPSVAIEIKDDAVNKDPEFWKRYRPDSISLRETNTYRDLDSIVMKEKYEKKLRIGRKIINGYIPFGPVDLDLRYLLSYNNYEGFRLGLGGITNERFSEKYRAEGYSAYGTKDGTFKYSLGGAARIGKFSGTWLGGSYTDDVREIASISFAVDRRVFKLYDPRPINVSTFYHYVTWRGFIETKIIPKTESIWQLTQSHIEPKFNYVFNDDGRLYNSFDMSTAMVSLLWSPFSDYMQTPTGRIETDKRFPKFTIQFTHSLPDVLGNDFEFGKIDFRAEYEKNYLDGQKTAVVLQAGYAYGDVPLTHLYSTSPNNLTKDRLLQRITLAGKNSFETMYFNEFFSSEYALLQLKHGLKRVTIFRKVRPALVFVTRMAWGNMEKPEQHIGIDYKTLEEGYFESGIELNQIYQGLGLSGFYRYGPNGLPGLEDNLSIKLSFILNLGI